MDWLFPLRSNNPLRSLPYEYVEGRDCRDTFNVLTQNRDGNAATGGNKIRFIPKNIFPVKAVDVFSKLAPNAAARYRLNVVNELR
jgi:hypothetical protein